MNDLSNEQKLGLDHARHLAEHGVPLFIARPALDANGDWVPDGGQSGTGYWLPGAWQHTKPNPAVVHRWQPGDALCAVTGQVVDGVDADIQKGGGASLKKLPDDGTMPLSYGRQSTPSGGTHDLIATLGVRSRDGLLPGLDVKAGDADGAGRGFLFVAPTAKLSKVTGEVGTYSWVEAPDLEKLETLEIIGEGDTSGVQLAALLNASRAVAPNGTVPASTDQAELYADLSPERRALADEKLERTSANFRRPLGEAVDWPEGFRDDTGRGWEALTRDAAFRLAQLGHAPWSPISPAEAKALYDHMLPDAIAGNPKCADKWPNKVKLDRERVVPPWDDPEWMSPFGPVPGEPEQGEARPTGRELAIREELERLVIREDARARFEVLRRPPAPAFDAGTLAEVLARPSEPKMRVEGLMPWDSNMVIAAQRKTGKTTLEINMAWSLLTGEPFLGRSVRPITGSVGFLNYEVSAAMLARWADEHGLDRERLYLVNLRGRRNPLSHPDDRAKLAELLRARAVETLIVDPFGRAYTGTSQNDSGEVGAWLADLDVFARGEVGARDTILSVHAGWAAEHSRGSSALEDWPDSIITMTRMEGTGDRYISAEGRDVELEEDRLLYDASTRRVSLSGAGSRRAAKATTSGEETRANILGVLAAHPEGLSGNELAEALNRKDPAFTAVRNTLVETELVAVSARKGKGGGRLLHADSGNLPEHTGTYRLGKYRTYRTTK